MSDTTGIEWCDSTFNPWSFPQGFAALALPIVADAVWLVVPQFVAWAGKRAAGSKLDGVECKAWPA